MWTIVTLLCAGLQCVPVLITGEYMSEKICNEKIQESIAKKPLLRGELIKCLPISKE